mgnify:CR=1 FL=1
MILSKDFTQSVFILILSTVIVASFSLLVWVVPNVFMASDLKKISLAKPLTAIELAGRDIYISEGCHVCHTQMVRPLEAEILRNGRANKEADDIYEFPNLWGSKRTGPDLARLGKKYPDLWHYMHMEDPRAVIKESIMPAYPWLITSKIDFDSLQKKGSEKYKPTFSK